MDVSSSLFTIGAQPRLTWRRSQCLLLPLLDILVQGLLQVHEFWLRRAFLGEALADGLLEYAASCEATMLPSTVGRQSLINPAKRTSAITSNLGDFRYVLEQHAQAVLADVTSAIGMRLFQPTDVEIQLAAHGHGAFYTRHIDTRTGLADTGVVRRISMVYYVHRRPRAFSRGTLRLSAIASDEFTDVEPVRDLLVAFPSWMPHEVLPVEVPSRRFADSRFAVNIWLRA